ncbi:MAG: acyl-CoA dehydrogenase [Gammaproteobacteria bacterium]|nr:acyl-CoA dehydrogenase [Gammaproteobacteria bacterium]MDH3767570.1 acyl-CoA dehydrogenase [Gammaproteobacteria bacterium]
MTVYHAPTRDMRFCIEELSDLEAIGRLPGFEAAESDVVQAVIEEAGRLATEVLAPLNPEGDRNGARIEGDDVRETPGFAAAYRQFVDGGWNSMPFPTEHGGGGLPSIVAFPVAEIWQASNMAFSLCPMLSQAAVEALIAHGTAELQKTYLPKLVSGDWTGTMDLTEPQAGSDLAAVSCKAVPQGDHYLITGQKIFITWGDHQMTDNIIHMVLARLPDAPAGVKGISLFLVPKFLVGADGTLGERNDMRPVSLEHKIGIHGSPTCVMSFGDNGGAVGYLVGEKHNGMSCMFTMMNLARLHVGIEGVGIAERAYQRAARYAKERVQGGAAGETGRVTIIHHPDVRRMLMTMKALVEGMRALCVCAGSAMDFALHSDDPKEKARNRERLDLLVPAVKGWCTEEGQEVASLAIQVHGGMGYVEETGAAQHFRDARIATIYEGTTGIQAQDLVGRKILRDEGRAMANLVADIRNTVQKIAQIGEFDDIENSLRIGVDLLESSTDFLISHQRDDVHTAGAVSFDLLMLTGLVTAGWQMARAALVAREKLDQGAEGSNFYQSKMVTAKFFAQHLLPRARAYGAAITAGSAAMMALDENQF